MHIELSDIGDCKKGIDLAMFMRDHPDLDGLFMRGTDESEMSDSEIHFINLISSEDLCGECLICVSTIPEIIEDKLWEGYESCKKCNKIKRIQ
jgi:hypothetical protein